MKRPLESRERSLLVAVLLLAAVALVGPALAQDAGYHEFADQQERWGVPHAADVLSNLGFALVGLLGAWRLAGAGGTLLPGERGTAWLSCAGLFATAAGSCWYHLAPDDAGVAVDRIGMSVAFAGVLGLATCRVSARAGRAMAALVLVAGPAAVLHWFGSGDLLPWAVVQGGGMLLLAGLAFMRPVQGAAAIRWGVVLAAYAVSKALELADHQVWDLTAGWVSGHSLKHVVAAAAMLPVVLAFRAAPRSQTPRARSDANLTRNSAKRPASRASRTSRIRSR